MNRKMASVARFLRPIRVSLAAATSPSPFLSLPRTVVHGDLQPLSSWAKTLGPVLRNGGSRIPWKSNAETIFSLGNLMKMGSILGVSAVIGSISYHPSVAYAMDGFDLLVDDHVTSELYDDPHVVLTLVKRFWLPVVLFVTVLLNWDYPVLLAAKLILILLGTKPSPPSVYLFVEQLRRQAMLREPLLYRFRKLHARRVEVEDFKVLCVARVELGSRDYTLIGILGNWWVLPVFAFQDSVFALKSSLYSSFKNF